MAGYRQIHTQIWKDEWFIELEPDEKFLFIYLFSNELSSISGLYKIPVRVMHNETGMPIERIEEIIGKFIKDDKIAYGDGVIWIKNMWRYHKNASPRTQIKVWQDINEIPDCRVKLDCIQYLYGIGTETLDALKDKAKAKAKAKDKSESESDDDDSQPDDDDEPSGAVWGELEIAFTSTTGLNGLLPNPETAYKAYEAMHKAGVTPQDVASACHILLSKDKYTVIGPSSIVNTAITEKTRRTYVGNTIKANPSGRQRGRRLVQ